MIGIQDNSIPDMNEKPIRLLLAGYFGFDNAGDEAIFESVVENFRRLDPDVQLTALVSGDQTAKRLGVETVPRTSLGAVWNAMRSHDLFVLGGGGLFQDTTGPNSVFYYGGLLTMAALARCPSVFFCQGYGPVRRPLLKFITRQVLRLPSLITVRDEESKAELASLGISEDKVHLAADPALLLSPLASEEIRGLLKEENLIGELGRSELPNGQLSSSGPLVVVTVRPWPGLPLEELGAALRTFREEVGARYLLLPFQPERDLEPSRRLVELLNGEARLIERELTPAALTGILACSDMVIGMRLHSLILATVGNPPLYGLSYDPKVERFCRRAGALSCNIEEISSERLLKEWVHVLNGRKTQRKSQEKAVSRMRDEAEQAFQASLALARGQNSREVAETLMMSSSG
jgi:polysaccharide pyruvyl transferase CsaB